MDVSAYLPDFAELASSGLSTFVVLFPAIAGLIVVIAVTRAGIRYFTKMFHGYQDSDFGENADFDWKKHERLTQWQFVRYRFLRDHGYSDDQATGAVLNEWDRKSQVYDRENQ